MEPWHIASALRQYLSYLPSSRVLKSAAAHQLREEAKERLRLDHFVSVQPSSSVQPISRNTLKGRRYALLS